QSDDEARAMRRIVYDNDHPSKRLAKAGVPPRWGPAGPNWSADSAQTPKAFTHTGGELTFLRYAHRVSAPPTDLRADGQVEPFGQSRYIDDWDKVAKGAPAAGLFPPSPITNFLGYNAGAEASPGGGVEVRQTGQYWVGDLMLECAAKVSGPQDAVVLELSRGVNRFQAKFADGKLALVRVGPGGKELASVPSPITGAGEYALRFANFDRRLRVWVNDRPVDLGPAADYSPDGATGFEAAVGALTGGAFVPRPDGHTLENDILAPASVGASGTVTVSKVKLWNDTFFTPAENARPTLDPDDPVDTFYVQPGHYLVLGDNSGQSSDSRKWGLVPDRLMLGKAIFVFFPLNRIGFIE
ncbi:MAG: S26 family signal peptidase, partial [Gemmataceae bacterium]